jgi:hypothetical protein
MARHRRDRNKERYWRGLLARWQRSGLSVRDFCDVERLSEASFYGWRRELALRDREAARAPSGAQHQTAPPMPPATQGRPLFVPVQVQTPSQADKHAIAIVLSGGYEVRVSPGFDSQTLQRVLRVLATPSAGGAAEGASC